LFEEARSTLTEGLKIEPSNKDLLNELQQVLEKQQKNRNKEKKMFSSMFS